MENLQAIKISQVKHGFGGWWFGHELAMFSVEIPLLHVAYGILHLLTSLSMSMICQTLFVMLASASGFSAKCVPPWLLSLSKSLPIKLSSKTSLEGAAYSGLASSLLTTDFTTPFSYSVHDAAIGLPFNLQWQGAQAVQEQYSEGMPQRG